MTSRASYLDNNPFNQEISEYILPKEFKIPKFHLYDDSTTDPDEHLHSGRAIRWFCGKKTPHELFYIKQGPYESLKEFVERFNEAILDIGECSNQEMIIPAFIHGLRQAALAKDLTIKLPTTIEELIVGKY
ncbi:hypothetical protein Tco_0917274, partial [Tanacetum coccineum]